MQIRKLNARSQYEWYQHVDSRYKPTGIELVGDDLYYDFIEGTPATDWRKVWSVAAGALWDGEPKLDINCSTYTQYVTKVAEKVMPDDVEAIHHAMAFLYTDRLTPVHRCHGDLTFANVINTHGRHKFIDPGDARGLPCREIDEAKMLQSLDGFGVVYRNWLDPTAYPKMPIRRVHWVLLMTHYIRLLAHVTHEPSLQFAKQRIKEITSLWA